MKTHFRILPLIAVIALAACNQPAEQEQKAKADSSLSKAVKQPLDKARQVENQIMDATEARKREIEDKSE